MSPSTIESYSRHVSKFSQFIAKPLNQTTAEAIRLFQLDMIENRKLAWSSFNQAVCSLRFFYRISDTRIVSADERQVTFLAREGKITGGQREQVPITMSTVEFTRRWSMHILPKGFTKSRCFGGWSNCRKGTYIQRCAMLLEDSTLPLSPKALNFDVSDFEPSITSEADCKNPLCPKCGAEMSQTSATAKRSWHVIMNSSNRPNWYSHIPPRL